MLELCLQEYRLVVLDGAFLCHAAVSKSHAAPRHARAERLNSERYTKILGALRHMYHDLSQTDIKSEDVTNYHDEFEEDINDPLVEVSQFVPFPRSSLVTKTVSNHEKRPSVGDEDDLRHFFNTMYTITKKMPALTQHKLKRKIFNIISDEEEYLLQARSMAESSDSK